MLKCKSFSLVELLVVISVIAILAGVIIPQYSVHRQKARDARRMEDIRAIQAALVMYKQRYGSYPPQYQSCDSSRGSCSPCPCSGSNWSEDSYIYSALVEDNNFISPLPKDPVNDTNYYYVYIPQKSESEITCGAGSCYYYRLRYIPEQGLDKCPFQVKETACELNGY
jgi:prepilin-type N-terminal cleavage/methylation domain-containing protein